MVKHIKHLLLFFVLAYLHNYTVTSQHLLTSSAICVCYFFWPVLTNVSLTKLTGNAFLSFKFYFYKGEFCLVTLC
jgi:hypothetical protein